MDRKDLQAIFGLLLIIVVVVLLIFGDGRSERIDTWAQNNGYRILEKETCFFDHGPFWFKGKHQTIFKLRLEKDDVRRTAYARVGWDIEVEFTEQ